jgi:L-serine/L-threonine ammonia-lyase
MDKLYLETPLMHSTPLSQVLGAPVFLKLEALQPSGSFKNRGIGRLCSFYAQQGKKCLTSFSGGNAGLAVAYAGRLLGIPVKVVVPATSSEIVREKIRQQGAEVIVHWDNWQFAEEEAKALADQEGGVYVHPFDHPLIWQGHSTLIEEIAAAGYKPGAIVLSVGGGGLLCGVLQGLHQAGWTDVPVFTAETNGTASFYTSVQKGYPVTLERIDSVATTLGAKRVANEAFNWTKKHPIYPQLVSDQQAIDACLKFADDHRLLVEPACGASLALIYDSKVALHSFSSVLVIVCGGSGVSRNLLQHWEEKWMHE